MPASVFMYADSETVKFLNQDISKVILFGGYLGYNNFGDILQLKGAIKYHNDFTRLEPVVICQMGSIPDSDYLSRLRKWFGVVPFIFIQDQPVDIESVNLCLIESSLPIDYLHAYGGGFLNRMWGDYCLRMIGGLIDNFRVENYIVSGQQIDVAIAGSLKSHFDKYRPKLIATRDLESQRIVRSIGYDCDYSFDDAADVIEPWTSRKTEPGDRRAVDALFVHLNTSKYAWNNSEEYKEELDQKVHILGKVHSKFQDLYPVFLNAYSEYRVEVRDTVSTIISMETALPFLDYRVIDIAHMALLHNPSDIDVDKNLGVFGSGLAISSSYHTAMFCNMLNIPCYLLSENVYYKQKRDGVGESRTLDQFLQNPSVLSYSSLLERRSVWLVKLTSFFENSARNLGRGPIEVHYNTNGSIRTPFYFKKISSCQNDDDILRIRLSELEASLDEKLSEIDRLESELSRSSRELCVHRSSLTWRYTSLLRCILDLFKK